MSLRDEIAKAIFARRYQTDSKSVDSMFQWYAAEPQGRDRLRMAIYSAFRDADAAIAVIEKQRATEPQPL